VKCGRRPIQEIRFKLANEKARDRSPGAGFCYFCDDEDMPVICPTCQTFLEGAHAVCCHACPRYEPTIDTDPRLALPPNEPWLHRIIAVEPAQLVIERRRRRELRRIPRIDASQSSQPAQQASREICIIGRSERRRGTLASDAEACGWPTIRGSKFAPVCCRRLVQAQAAPDSGRQGQPGN